MLVKQMFTSQPINLTNMQILERSDYFLKLISQHLLISFTALLLVAFFGILIGGRFNYQMQLFYLQNYKKF